MIWLLSRSKLVLFYIYDLLSLILLLHEVDFSYKKIRLAWFCHLQFNVNCIDWLRRIFVGLCVWFFPRKNCSLLIWSNESIFFFKNVYIFKLFDLKLLLIWRHLQMARWRYVLMRLCFVLFWKLKLIHIQLWLFEWYSQLIFIYCTYIVNVEIQISSS